MFLFIKIAIAVTIIAIASYVNIDAIWAWVSNWKSETVMIVTAIASIVIAGIASLATVMQGVHNREHNRRSVQPLLTCVHDFKKSGNITYVQFDILNSGTGPAIIKNFISVVDGKELTRNDVKEHYKFFDVNTQGFGVMLVGFTGPDSIIRVGEQQNLWTFEYDRTTHNADFIDRMKLVIEYQSIYRDRVFTYSPKELK